MAKVGTKVSQTMERKFLGDEPIYPIITGRSDPNLGKALNWYNYSYDSKAGKPWLVQWMKNQKFSKNEIDFIKKMPDWAIRTTCCWLAKMSLNGTEFHKDNIQYMNDMINEMITSHKERKGYVEDELEGTPEELKEPKKVDIQQRTLLKNNALLSMAEEEVVDAMGSMYEFLKKNNATALAASHMRSYYYPALEEINCDDPQVKEAYGKDFKKWQKFYQTLIDDIDRYIGNNKAAKPRKPKTPKEKPLGKLVEKLKYQKEEPSLKLVSVNPQQIVGAQTLWVYNTKDRKLGVYHAQGPAGLTIKGTTIVNFNVETSVCKRLRKPEQHTKAVLDAGKVAIKKILEGINAVEIKLTGRINADTILLRVIK